MPVLLFSVIAHEYAHGYAALKQGDTTALAAGRLTWNPIKHIDPVDDGAAARAPVLSVARHGRPRRRQAGAGRSAQLSQLSSAATSSSRSPASLRTCSSRVVCTVVIALLGLAGRADAASSRPPASSRR